MKWVVVALVGALLLVGIFRAYSDWANARVVRELRGDPQGKRAGRVMLLTLPSGKALPVNYLREGDTVYAAADFPWWRELRSGGGRGSVLIRGETLHGHVRAETGDPELRASVFGRLRPTAPAWTGTMIVVEVDPVAGSSSPARDGF
jgi:hypothetical protein